MSTIVAVLWLLLQIPGTNAYQLVMYENFNDAKVCYAMAEDWNSKFEESRLTEGDSVIAVCAPYIVTRTQGEKI